MASSKDALHRPFSHSCALRSIADALEAAHSNGEVSFEEARALRWLKDDRNAALAAPVAAPASTLPPINEAAVAAQHAPPGAVTPQLLEPVVVAAHEPVAIEVAAPDQAATAEVPQVANYRALQLASKA
jgi:uncharacterized protein (DUF2252 family)